MSFNYQKPFPILKDDTNYRLLSKEFVSTIQLDGREILKIDPQKVEQFYKDKPELENYKIAIDDIVSFSLFI